MTFFYQVHKPFWISILFRLAMLLFFFGETTAFFRLSAQESTPEPNVNFADVGIVNAYITTTNANPQLGEPFEITLIAEMPSTVTLQDWVTLGASLYPLEILEQSDVTSAINNQQIIYQQTLKVVLWTVGDYISPELRLTYIQNGTLQFSPVRSVSLNVPSLIAQSASTDLRPSLKPVDLPFIPLYVYVLVIFAIALIVYGVLRLFKKHEGRVMGIFGGDVTQVLLAELEDLKHQTVAPEQIYLVVAEKIRTYIQIRTNVNAIEMTTRELAEQLRDNDQLPIALLRDMQTILDQADLVKFAQFEPDNNISRYINFAIRWVNNVNQHLKDRVND